MLQTNQRLDKLATMRSDFVSHGMLPASHTGGRQISHIAKSSELQHFSDDEDSDSEPVEEQDISEDVILAHTRGTSISLVDK